MNVTQSCSTRLEMNILAEFDYENQLGSQNHDKIIFFARADEDNIRLLHLRAMV